MKGIRRGRAAVSSTKGSDPSCCCCGPGEEEEPGLGLLGPAWFREVEGLAVSIAPLSAVPLHGNNPNHKKLKDNSVPDWFNARVTPITPYSRNLVTSVVGIVFRYLLL
jgi:hypothetical protein